MGFGLLGFAALGSMCQGPAGPPGTGGVHFTLGFMEPLPVLRADGVSETQIGVWVKTSTGNNAMGVPVSFQVLYGSGSANPAEDSTDAMGRAHTTFRAGDQSGFTILVASIQSGGIEISVADSLYLDPFTVSAPILPQDQPDPIHARWSADGSRLLYSISSGADDRLYSVPSGGGEPSLLGLYRGGDWSLDGTNRVAVCNDSGYWILDANGQVISGPMLPAQIGPYMKDIYWIYGGDSLLVLSSYGNYLYVCHPNGACGSSIYAPVYTRAVSADLGTSKVWVEGADLSCGQVHELDLRTRTFRRLRLFCTEGQSSDPSSDQLVVALSPSSGYESDYDLVTVSLEGLQRDVLLASPADEIYPAWSPDGTYIVFCSDRSGAGYNLYTMQVR